VPKKSGEFWRNLPDFSFELRVSMRLPVGTYCVFFGITPRVFCEPKVATETPKMMIMGVASFSGESGGATEEEVLMVVVVFHYLNTNQTY
jgi:hypothetical protein